MPESSSRNLQPVYLPSVVASAVQGVGPLASARGIAIVVTAEGGTVMGHHDELRDTIATALSHALRDTADGGTVHVKVTRDDVHAAIVIGDADAIAFTLQLPLLPFGLRPGKDSGVRTPGVCTGLRVLVVDDDPDARTLVADALRRHGATVDVAASTLYALVALARDRYDVLVTDLAMPRDDGFNLIGQLRREPSPNMAVPVIALTGYADVETRDRATTAGFAAFVTKPVSHAALASVVAAIGKG